VLERERKRQWADVAFATENSTSKAFTGVGWFLAAVVP
jgi:hypothetical protein